MDNHKKATLVYTLAAGIAIFAGWVINPTFAAITYLLIVLAVKEVIQS